MSTEAISAAIAQVTDRIGAACAAAGRDPRDVALVVATKTVTTERTVEAVRAGAVLLGESRVQDIAAKAPTLAALAERPRVHMIGRLQSNKINALLRAGDVVTCVETVDSLSLAQALGSRAAAAGRILDVLVQVNVSGEETKAGATPDDAVALATAVAVVPGLRLRGLMTIGANSRDAVLVRAGYARLRELRDAVLASGAPGTEEATELSMGMSADLELAIAEGATIVRVGTAILGARPVAG